MTTLLDWSHINNTPDHADEAIGPAELGTRAVYCYGNTSLADWWFNSVLEAPEDIRRVRDRLSDSGS